MKEKEKWSELYVNLLEGSDKEVIYPYGYDRVAKDSFIKGFDFAKQKFIEMLQMPAKNGINELINLGEKEL